MRGFGDTHTSFRRDDPRSVLQKAEARAVVALAAVLWEPGANPKSSDGDVRRGYEMAGVACAGDSDAWVAARARMASAMTRDLRFRAVAGAIEMALLTEREIIGDSLLGLAVEAQLP